MKKLFVLIFCLLLMSCSQNPNHEEEVEEENVEEIEEEEQICACGVTDPAKELPWLAELIAKAEDRKGNYFGDIWFEKYDGQDVFVTNMKYGAGCIMYPVFDCEGNHLDIPEPTQDFYDQLQKDKVIYVFPDDQEITENKELTCHWELAWDYPVKPGTPEWLELSSKEMFDICQIPEEILYSLSTKDLTVICLEWWFMTMYLTSYQSLYRGIDAMFNNFNGVRELFLREDVWKEFLKQYQCKMLNLSILDDPDAEGKFSYRRSIVTLQALITRYHSQDDVIENYREILQHLVCGYEKILEYQDFKSDVIGTNFFARAHLIIKISPQSIEKFPKGDKNNIFYSDWILEKETADVINELSYH